MSPQERHHPVTRTSAVDSAQAMTSGVPTTAAAGGITALYARAAALDRVGVGIARAALVIVLVWIGGLKFTDYEAEGIVPFVANSPAMSFLYHHPADYHGHLTKEGETNPANRQWNQENGTFAVSYLLGAMIVGLAILIALHPWFPQVAAVGSGLVVLMACTTLSFLVTTPEAWVPAQGDPLHGFPFLAGPGRLVIKDCIMFGAAIVTMADSAKSHLRRSAARA
jgi:reactive chlorine resistance protein C